MNFTKDIMDRKEALALAPDYVAYVEGDYSKFSEVNEAFSGLKRRQKAITYYDGKFIRVEVTSIDHDSYRAIDGPVVRVGNSEYTWRVDGSGYAWPV